MDHLATNSLRSESPPEGALPALYRRVRYDPEIEADALERLLRGDREGCRRRFRDLVSGLDTARGDGSALAQLLLDVLQRVNHTLHSADGRGAAYQFHRMALIDGFRTCESSREAVGRFLPALGRILEGAPERRRGLPVVERARAFLDAHFARRISLAAVAGELHVAPNYLSRMFHCETGVTLTAYLHRRRVEHALRLMERSECSLAEIADLVGYQSYRDFHRNFVKHRGEPPSAERRRARTDLP